MAIWIILAVLLLLAGAFLGLCRMIGSKFLKNLARKNPGEKFTANMDVSFYQNGPLAPLAQKGMDYMDTLPREEVTITSRDGLKLHGYLFPAEEHPKRSFWASTAFSPTPSTSLPPTSPTTGPGASACCCPTTGPTTTARATTSPWV